jgi:hypothetical protein
MLVLHLFILLSSARLFSRLFFLHTLLLITHPIVLLLSPLLLFILLLFLPGISVFGETLSFELRQVFPDSLLGAVGLISLVVQIGLFLETLAAEILCGACC